MAFHSLSIGIQQGTHNERPAREDLFILPQLKVLLESSFAGMLGVTFFGVFLTPVFFYLLRRHSDWAEVPVQQRE